VFERVLGVFCGEIFIFVEMICNLLERGDHELDSIDSFVDGSLFLQNV